MAKNQFNQQTQVVWADTDIAALVSQNGYSFPDNKTTLVCTSNTMVKNAMKELAGKFPGCNVYCSKPALMQTASVTIGKLIVITPDGEVLPE